MGKQTEQVKIPEWAQKASQEAIALSKKIGQIDYLPYYGPDVAAFTPMQQQAMQGRYDAASAFGLAPAGGDAMAGIPAPKDFGGGHMAYSSGDLFDVARAELASRHPQLAQARNSLFSATYSNPVTSAPITPGPMNDPGFTPPGGTLYGGLANIPGIGIDPNSPEWQAFIQQFQNTQVV